MLTVPLLTLNPWQGKASKHAAATNVYKWVTRAVSYDVVDTPEIHVTEHAWDQFFFNHPWINCFLEKRAGVGLIVCYPVLFYNFTVFGNFVMRHNIMWCHFCVYQAVDKIWWKTRWLQYCWRRDRMCGWWTRNGGDDVGNCCRADGLCDYCTNWWKWGTERCLTWDRRRATAMHSPSFLFISA